MNDMQFKLERYRSGGANRYTCPHCGRKRCFTRYVNSVTGEYVSDDCGKCNHESSCGYHYPPRDYFRDNSSSWDRKTERSLKWTGEKQADTKKPYVPIQQEEPQTVFFSKSWVEESSKRNSTFRSWFLRLPFDDSLKQEVLAEYCVGGTSNDTVVKGLNYGPAVIFWGIDECQLVHDAKLMAYTCDGHRVPEWGDSMRSICIKKKIGPQLTHTDKVLFGMHLLPRYPDKPVCIVESEKSALVCACAYPQNLWLATGGCGNLNAQKLLPLMDRHLIVFPDSGEYGKWHERVVASGHKHFYVVSDLEKYENNTDIADLILGKAKLRTT